MILHHPPSGETGTPDAAGEHPDGAKIIRINDHWFFLRDCQVVM